LTAIYDQTSFFWFRVAGEFKEEKIFVKLNFDFERKNLCATKNSKDIHTSVCIGKARGPHYKNFSVSTE
jgi:hypothetical protein